MKARTKASEIKTIKTNLDEANSKQESFKKDRPVLTQERVGKLNAAWTRMQDVCNTAKFVYPNDYAKQSRYIINESGGTTPAPTPPENPPVK